MPAKDIIHDAVKNALVKDGWAIIADPFRLEYEDLELAADLAAERTLAAEKAGEKIIVEVKSFVGRSFIREFQQALGQYTLYRDIIELTHLEYNLYLAIDQLVYQTFFVEKAVQVIAHRHHMGLIIVNVKQEEIVKWIK